MTSTDSPTPVILCGLSETIGSGVIEGLKPEYEGAYSRCNA